MTAHSEIRVIHSVPSWLPYTEIWIYNQLKHMESVESGVVANFTQNLKQFAWSPLYSMKKPHYFVFRIMRRLGYRWYPSVYDEAIRGHKPDIIHSHFGLTGWFDIPLVKRYGLGQVVTFYGFDVNMLPTKRPIWKKRYQELFYNAELFLCEGPHMARCLVDLGCPQEKVKVQRIGIEIEKIPYRPRRLQYGKPLKILIASSFREKKGIPYALEAIGRFRKQYPNLRITIIGDASSEKRSQQEKQRILTCIYRYDLQSVTDLVGYQPYSVLMDMAYKSHIYLAPSVTASDGDTEGGGPISIIEMMASGMPVVSTFHCDIPQIIKDGVTGLLAKERDVNGLMTHLEWLIANPDKWDELTRRGRKHVEENFDVRHQATALTKVYRTVLGEH